MSQEEGADYNETLPTKEQVDGLSVGTIKDTCFSPIRMFFKDAGAQYDFLSPLFDLDIKVPNSPKGLSGENPPRPKT